MNNQVKKLKTAASFLVLGIVLFACGPSGKIGNAKNEYPSFYSIGHRGARGLVPENTIPSVKRAVEEGANTIEVDVHISKDGKVVVYHDPSMNPEYTLLPDGREIPSQERKKYTLYQMNYDKIRPFIIGTKYYAPFPQQEQIATYAPLLSELIDSVEAFTKEGKLPGVYYLVEIKSNEQTDGVEQPTPEEYVEILMEELKPKHLGRRLIIQSFDRRPLQVLHHKYPEVALGFLTGDRNASFEDNLGKLGFLPVFYNPVYSLVTPELVRKCHERKMLLAPWTVNEAAAMKELKGMGVDGIITDYPDRLKSKVSD